MSSTITEVIFLSIFSFWAWKLYLFFFDKSALSDIPGPPNPSMFKGNFRQIFDRKGLQFHLDLLEKYGGAVKIHGPFGEEQVYVSDPRALHYITVKEQNIYDEVPGFYASNEMVFGTSLLSTKGDQHRKQRKMLNPVFSLKHMRDLAPIFYPIAHRLRDLLREKVRKGEGKELNVMKWMSRAALEYIGQGGLGYSFDALDESKTNKYSEAVRMLAPTAFNLYLFRQYTHYIKKLGSPEFRLFLLKLTPWPDLHKVKKIVDVMDETSIAIYNEKKEKLRLGDEAVVNQVGRGKDIMSVLLQANMAANEADRLPEEELLGQMNTFIFAGHDTTTSALSRILHVLTLNPEMQVKLREELTEALKEHGEEMDYDTLMALPYLDSVCREVMRLYPPAPLLNRVTMQPTTLPLYRPIRTIAGELIQSIPLKKNTRVVVSLLGANRNKDVWGEDADEFKPERWLAKREREAKQDNWFEEKKEESDKVALPGVYSGMMTFSGGGRACIGFKFSELEKLFYLLLFRHSNFRLSRVKKLSGTWVTYSHLL